MAEDSLSVNGSMSCTTGQCRIQLTSGAMLAVRGSVWCGGTSMCLVDVQAGGDASVSGSIAGSDVRVVAAGTVNVSGTISASGQGSPANSGAGKGLPGASGSSSSDSYLLVSGSGGGHGGSGASGCYLYSSGSLPAGGVSYGTASAPSSIGSGGGAGATTTMTVLMATIPKLDTPRREELEGVGSLSTQARSSWETSL